MPANHFDGYQSFAFSFATGAVGESLDFPLALARPHRPTRVAEEPRWCMAYDVYRITIKGHLDCEWSDWFDGLTITLGDNGETILTGPLIDQSALHGVLIKIRDLG